MNRTTRLTSSWCSAAIATLALTMPGCYQCIDDATGNGYGDIYLVPPDPDPCEPNGGIGYARIFKTKPQPPAFNAKLTSARNDDGLKSPFFAVQARKGATDADGLGVLPFDLAPGFSVEVTCGIFTPKLDGGVDGGFFGLEIAGPDRNQELYAIYAERSSNPEGLTIRAVTRDGVQGAEKFLPGATKVDLSATSTGSSVSLAYRVTGGPSPFSTPIATVALASQGPFRAVTAVYDVDSKGQVGFTNLRIPETGVAAKPKATTSPQAHAVDQILSGVRVAMIGVAVLNSGAPSQDLATQASFRFSAAMASFTTAMNDLDAFEGRDADRARTALDKAWRLCGATGRALTVDPPEREVPLQLRTFANKLTPLVRTALENVGRL